MRLIDADALKEAWVERLYVYIVNNGGDVFGAVKDKAALEFIDEQPTIEPVKHGKWTKCIDACGECVIVQCSECFEDFDYIDGLCYLCHGQELPNYCPNCGAKMERSEENDGKNHN